MQISRLHVGIILGIFFLATILYVSFRNQNPVMENVSLPQADTIEIGVTSDPVSPVLKNVPLKQAPVNTEPSKQSVEVKSSPVSKSSLLGKQAPELVRPTGYSNIDTLGIVSTEQLTLKRWIGQKVILLEFWTSSSLASLHTIPYLNYWYQTYRNDGLLVIGVHAPQFSFERSKTVVDNKIFQMGIHFPVVIDNDYSTWTAYKNSAWPHLYLIDTKGRIVYEHLGDGAYEQTQAKIMELLAEQAKINGTSFAYQKFQTPKDAFVSDVNQQISPETFFGTVRNQSISNAITNKEGPQSVEGTPPSLHKSTLSGSWNFNREFIQSMTESSSFSYRYRAKNVYATLSAEKATKVVVQQDSRPIPNGDAGADIVYEKGESVIYVKEPRLYSVVKNSNGYGEHIITLLPSAGGLNAYSLLFE